MDAEQNTWLQTEYSCILFRQCSSYLEGLDGIAKPAFHGGIKARRERGDFEIHIILQSLCEPNLAYTSTWGETKDLVSTKIKRNVRCSEQLSNLIENVHLSRLNPHGKVLWDTQRASWSSLYPACGLRRL